MFVGVRLTHGTLISGALANRMIWVRLGRLVPPEPLWGTGVGRSARESGWVWTHCWVLRKRAALGPPPSGGGLEACSLALLVRGWVPLFLVCGTALRSHRLTCHRVGVWWWGGCGRCLLFEICIVDASIFVAKFFRAHGGCLGIRSR